MMANRPPTQAVWFGVQSLFVCLMACGMFLTAGCRRATPFPIPTASPTAFRPHTPTPTWTPTLIPSPTPIPLVASVNGEGIPLAEWLAETERLRQALPEASEKTLQEQALSALVAETLLAQAAREAGYPITEQDVDARMQALIEEAGGTAAFVARLHAMGYVDVAIFRRALARQMAATWMRNRILEDLPKEVEQVEVRQILRYREDEAQAIYAQLQAGRDFLALAFAYDPNTGGYLGWMPRKVWPSQELEEAVFSLEPGTYTPVVASPLGYHIVYLIRKDVRPLPAWAWRIWAEEALRVWITQAWEQAQIEVYVPEVRPVPPGGDPNGSDTQP